MFKISWSLITNTIFFWNFWSAHLQNFLNTSSWRHISKTKLFTDTYLCSASLTSPKDALSEKNVLVLIFLIDISSGCLICIYSFWSIRLEDVFKMSSNYHLKTFWRRFSRHSFTGISVSLSKLAHLFWVVFFLFHSFLCNILLLHHWCNYYWLYYWIYSIYPLVLLLKYFPQLPIIHFTNIAILIIINYNNY